MNRRDGVTSGEVSLSSSLSLMQWVGWEMEEEEREREDLDLAARRSIQWRVCVVCVCV